MLRAWNNWRALRGLLCATSLVSLVSGCAFTGISPPTVASSYGSAAAPSGGDDYVPPLAYAAPEAPQAGSLNGSIGRYAALYEVPESLIRRIIVRESAYNPRARNGPYWGLMQIRYDTARSMGYDGSPAGLLDTDVNLRYGVKYLAGAYKVARGNPDRAVGFYASGYYYDARRMGLLDQVGLKRGKY